MTEVQIPAAEYKTYRRTVSHREAVEAFKRLKTRKSTQTDGQDTLPARVVRFSFIARLEHFILVISTVILAVTGLAQTYDNTDIARKFLLWAGGLEIVQNYHHLFGWVLVILAVYHTWDAIDAKFVRYQHSRVGLEGSDFSHFIQNLKLLFGFSKKLPLYDRYSFDEKFTYWVTAITVGVLCITGLIMRYPTLVTSILPGSVYPYSVVFHRWPALGLVLVSVVLHLYQVLLRKVNFSMFSGSMSLEEMQLDHPVELAYLVKAAGLVQEKKWPQVVTFTVEERLARTYAEVYAELMDDYVEIPIPEDELAEIEAKAKAEAEASVKTAEQMPIENVPEIVEVIPEINQQTAVTVDIDETATINEDLSEEEGVVIEEETSIPGNPITAETQDNNEIEI